MTTTTTTEEPTTVPPETGYPGIGYPPGWEGGKPGGKPGDPGYPGGGNTDDLGGHDLYDDGDATGTEKEQQGAILIRRPHFRWGDGVVEKWAK